MKMGWRQWLTFAIVFSACVGILIFMSARGDLVFQPTVPRSKADAVMKEASNFPCEPMRYGWVRINERTFGVEVAESDAQQARGLMFRKKLQKNEGMLFVFDEAAIRSFWMKNTLVYLDLAYIDENMKIISIHKMKPLDEKSVVSEGMAKYVLEVPKGQLKAAKAKVGDSVTWGYF